MRCGCGNELMTGDVEGICTRCRNAMNQANYRGGFMPDIKIQQEVEYEVNIDVYCGTCGKGLCGDTMVDNRRMSFTVEACPNCMADKDEKIKELENIIEQLESAACV